MSGLDGLGQIVYVVDMLEAAGAIVDSHCGLHVHVSGDGLATENGYTDERAIATLVADFTVFEKLFLSLSGSKAQSRMNNHYCALTNSWGFAGEYIDKFRSLNLVNMARDNKTVEFRLFAAELDVEYILTAVYMSVALVANVANGGSFVQSVNGNGPNRSSQMSTWVNAFALSVWGNSDNLILGNEDIKDVHDKLASQAELAF